MKNKSKNKKEKNNQASIPSSDWWHEITEEEKAAIERGLEDVKNNKLISHEEVLKEIKKWL